MLCLSLATIEEDVLEECMQCSPQPRHPAHSECNTSRFTLHSLEIIMIFVDCIATIENINIDLTSGLIASACGGRRTFGFVERFAAPQRPSAVGVLVLVPRGGSARLRRAITQALRA